MTKGIAVKVCFAAWLLAALLPISLRAAQKESRPKDIVEIIEGIPLVPLDKSVLLKSGEMLVPIDRILKVETAYVAATRRQHPRYTMQPQERIRLLKHFGFQFLMNALVEKLAGEKKLDAKVFEERFEKLKKAKLAQGLSYEQHLIDNGLTDEEFRRFWNARWTLEEQYAQTITEEQVEAQLKEFLSEHNMPLRRISHMLFAYAGAEAAPPTVARNKQDAYIAAQETIKRLAKGDDFESLAKIISDCPSREAGGDLDYIPRKDKVAEPLAAAAYKLEKVGDVTKEPVETEFGFHVVKLTGLRSAEDIRADVMKRKTPEQLRAEVRQHLVNEKFNKTLQQLVAEAARDAQFNVMYLEVEKGPQNP